MYSTINIPIVFNLMGRSIKSSYHKIILIFVCN